MTTATLGWAGIVRLGLVQTAIGAIVVLTTATMNRVMVVELALPAMLPGALVALHYAIQVLRPRLGHGSDVGGRRTPWILGGMAVLAAGSVGAAAGTAWMETNVTAGIVLAVISFMFIGLGVGASGTSLLALLAKRVPEQRRAAAATIVWLMMIAGFAVTATLAGEFLDPFSGQRLILVTATVAGLALCVTALAVYRLESRPSESVTAVGDAPQSVPFAVALRNVWGEPKTRRFSVFVFVSMLAYSAQDLILEPFAGTVFGMTPGESTKLAGVQHGGVLLGMILVALIGSFGATRRVFSLTALAVVGCLFSAAALVSLGAGGLLSPGWPLRLNVFLLGFSNGMFAVAAIGAMMGLAGAGRPRREGIRMGVWDAAQAIAFGLGGFLGTAAIDVSRGLLDNAAVAYAWVFTGEAVMFVTAACLAAWAMRRVDSNPQVASDLAGRPAVGEVGAQ